MNFLGHLYIGRQQVPELQWGNFIADAVKGDPYRKLPSAVADGVMLHRHIDAYTDAHTAVLAVVDLLHAEVGRLATVAVDIVIDHVLSRDWPNWHPQGLDQFSTQTSALLHMGEVHFPDRVKQYFPHMVQHNWLMGYGTQRGMRLALEGIESRLSFRSNIAHAAQVYQTHQATIDPLVNRFLHDVSAKFQPQSM